MTIFIGGCYVPSQMGGLFSIVFTTKKNSFFHHVFITVYFFTTFHFFTIFSPFFPVVYIPHYHSSCKKKMENTEQLATGVHGLHDKGLGVDIGELCTVS
jgi:predicted membrane protein